MILNLGFLLIYLVKLLLKHEVSLKDDYLKFCLENGFHLLDQIRLNCILKNKSKKDFFPYFEVGLKLEN